MNLRLLIGVVPPLENESDLFGGEDPVTRAILHFFEHLILDLPATVCIVIIMEHVVECATEQIPQRSSYGIQKLVF